MADISEMVHPHLRAKLIIYNIYEMNQGERKHDSL